MKKPSTPVPRKDLPKKKTSGAAELNELRELFIDSLKDIYWAENELTKALPKMAENATTPLLRGLITEHLELTKLHIARLEDVFGILGEKAEAKKCDAMAGLITEGEHMMRETAQGAVRDAAIIAAAQKVEHYEIASYGTLCAFAKVLGENDAAVLLNKTLFEEKESDMLLSDAAFNSVNFSAAVE